MSVIVSHANLNMQSKVKLFASTLYNYSVITKAIGTESSKKNKLYANTLEIMRST